MGQTARDLTQQLIGRLVPQAFIQRLETIQIDIEHRQPMVTAATTLTGTVQTFLEQAAIGQPGQLVEVGQITQTLLDLAPDAEVGNKCDHIANVALPVAHHAHLRPLRVDLAILAGFDQLALPAAVLRQAFSNRRILLATVLGAGQQGDASADQFGSAETGQVAASLINRQQIELGVHDRHALARRLEHRRGQPQLLGLTMALADVSPGSDHAQGTATGIALGDATTVFDPYEATVAQHRPVLHGIAVGLALQVIDHVLPDTRAIFRMHLRTLLVDQQQSVTQAYTKNHVHPRMEDLAIGHVPIPHA